jgi:hypothetical protein
VSFVVIASSSCPFDCAGLAKGDLGGNPFAGLMVVGKTVALAIWSKDRRELEVEDGLEFFRLRAGKGGLPCSPELVDPGPPAPFVPPPPIAFLPGLMLRTRSFPALAFFKTLMTLSFSNCSSAFFIVCAALLACNDWRISGDVTCPGRKAPPDGTRGLGITGGVWAAFPF